jgi:hypothetical protein
VVTGHIVMICHPSAFDVFLTVYQIRPNPSKSRSFHVILWRKSVLKVFKTWLEIIHNSSDVYHLVDLHLKMIFFVNFVVVFCLKFVGSPILPWHLWRHDRVTEKRHFHPQKCHFLAFSLHSKGYKQTLHSENTQITDNNFYTSLT